MDPSSEISFELTPVIRQFKDGRVERLTVEDLVAASDDSTTGVSSKDVVVDPSSGLLARIYIPSAATEAGGGGGKKKLPVLVYFHGGCFVAGSAFSRADHAFLNLLTSKADAIAVSGEYRLAPEHPLPAAYDDAWAVLKWVAAGTDPWLQQHGDLAGVHVLGFSAGGNIAHNAVIRAGAEGTDGVQIKSLVLIHPFFLSSQASLSESKNRDLRTKLEELWQHVVWPQEAAPVSVDDPRVNPRAPSLKTLGCARVSVCVDDDELKLRGVAYHRELLASRWPEEEATLFESAGEAHGFFLESPDSPAARALVDHIVGFFLS